MKGFCPCYVYLWSLNPILPHSKFISICWWTWSFKIHKYYIGFDKLKAAWAYWCCCCSCWWRCAAVEQSFADSSRVDDTEKESLFSINALKCPPPAARVQAATKSTTWQRVRKKKEEADVNSVASSRVTRNSCNGKLGKSKKIFSSTYPIPFCRLISKFNTTQ
jgi:hypothetical protein